MGAWLCRWRNALCKLGQEFVDGAGDSSVTLRKGHRGNTQRPASNSGRRDAGFNVRPRDDTHVGE